MGPIRSTTLSIIKSTSSVGNVSSAFIFVFLNYSAILSAIYFTHHP